MLKVMQVAKPFKGVILLPAGTMLLYSIPTKAALITYELSNLGDNSYQYDFTVDNSGPVEVINSGDKFNSNDLQAIKRHCNEY